MAGIVGGKIALRGKIDAQQIADRVGVFGPIETLGGHAARIRLHIAIGSLKFSPDIFDQSFNLCGGGLRRALGRHLAISDSLYDPLPAVAVLGQGGGSGERGKIETTGSQSIVVACRAIPVKQRQHRSIKSGGGNMSLRRRAHHPRGKHGQESKQSKHPDYRLSKSEAVTKDPRSDKRKMGRLE